MELYGSAGEREHPAALQALAMAYRYGELGLEPDEAESRRYTMEAEHAIQHRQAPPWAAGPRGGVTLEVAVTTS